MPINPHALDERDPRFADQRWLMDRDSFPTQRGSLLMPLDQHALHRTAR